MWTDLIVVVVVVIVVIIIIVIGVEDATAHSFLSHTDWKLELAVNEFFENPDMYPLSVNPSPVDKRKLETLFTRYKGTAIPLPGQLHG